MTGSVRFAALAICLLVAACGRSPLYLSEQRQIDYLEISRPALSPDGRFMAFDFALYTKSWDKVFGRRNHIAIYDIEARSIDLIHSNHEWYGYHSPSFAGDNRTLVAMQHCSFGSCPREDSGHQIVLMDVEGQHSQRITDGRVPDYLWSDSPGLPPEREKSSLVRSRPLFVPSERAVYYVGSSRNLEPFGRSVHNPDVVEHQLLRVDLATGEESLAMAPDSGAVAFRNWGRIAPAGERRLLISGGEARGGAESDWYNEIGANVFFFDLDSKRLTPLFPNPSELGEALGRAGKDQRSLRPFSLTSSADGRRIAFIDTSPGPGVTAVWLYEDGAFRAPLDFTAYGIASADSATLSADGRWLAVMDYRSNEHFALMDLDSGEVRQLPLRAPLRSAMQRTWLMWRPNQS